MSHPQLPKMSFDDIFDLTAGVLSFYNMFSYVPRLLQRIPFLLEYFTLSHYVSPTLYYCPTRAHTCSHVLLLPTTGISLSLTTTATTTTTPKNPERRREPFASYYRFTRLLAPIPATRNLTPIPTSSAMGPETGPLSLSALCAAQSRTLMATSALSR